MQQTCPSRLEVGPPDPLADVGRTASSASATAKSKVTVILFFVTRFDRAAPCLAAGDLGRIAILTYQLALLGKFAMCISAA